MKKERVESQTRQQKEKSKESPGMQQQRTTGIIQARRQNGFGVGLRERGEGEEEWRED